MPDTPKISLEDAGCEAGEPFALRVLGDSMSPEFPDGSIIIIEPANDAQDGNYIIAEVEGEFIFRQLCVKDGRYLIKALNPGYPTLDITGTQSIKGVITQRAGTRRKHRKHYL